MTQIGMPQNLGIRITGGSRPGSALPGSQAQTGAQFNQALDRALGTESTPERAGQVEMSPGTQGQGDLLAGQEDFLVGQEDFLAGQSSELEIAEPKAGFLIPTFGQVPVPVPEPEPGPAPEPAPGGSFSPQNPTVEQTGADTKDPEITANTNLTLSQLGHGTQNVPVQIAPVQLTPVQSPGQPPAQTGAVSTEPDAVEVVGTEPKTTEPKTTEPKTTEPKNTEPKNTEPKGVPEVRSSGQIVEPAPAHVPVQGNHASETAGAQQVVAAVGTITAPPAAQAGVVEPVPVRHSGPEMGQQMLSQLRGPLGQLRTAAPGEHVFTIRITPENMGPVHVRAHIGPENVRVELIGATDLVRDQLRTMLTDLRRDLQSTGLNAQLGVSSNSSSTADRPGQDGLAGEFRALRDQQSQSGNSPGTTSGKQQQEAPTGFVPDPEMPSNLMTLGAPRVDILA